MNTLRLGDTGYDVTLLQTALKRRGLTVEVDGHFGPRLEAAVRAFQASAGLVADGIMGPKTWAAINQGKADPKHLRQADLLQAADRLGVPVACIMAVNEVETTGEGFLPDGRPKILYERHVMYRQLTIHKLDAAYWERQLPAVVNQTRGGYTGGSIEYMRLARARNIHDESALESTSWGAFQIMGYHWERLDYASVQAFVDNQCLHEGAQLGDFVKFIQSDDVLLKALRARKWSVFASRYNGPDYQRNLYDVKMARAFEHYSKLLAASEVSA